MNRGAVLMMIYDCVRFKKFVKNAEWNRKEVSFDIGSYKFKITLTRKKIKSEE